MENEKRKTNLYTLVHSSLTSSSSASAVFHISTTHHADTLYTGAVLIVLSGNGYRSISDCRVELFFPRCGMDVMAYRAGLAVMDENSNTGDYMSAVATHSFMARQFGVDRKAAFKELMFDIEAMLESHLHNGNTHISRYGIGGGQKELESQMRNRAIKSVEETISPAEAAHAMNGDTEPYLRPQRSHTTMTTIPAHMAKRNSNYGGFVVGEVESQYSATAPSPHPTTGGVGAVPYGRWMQSHGTAAPLPPRARQMWPRTMPIERPPGHMSSADSSSSLSVGASVGHWDTRSYYGAQTHDRRSMSFLPSMGFMPLDQSSGSSRHPAPPSSSISDPAGRPPSSPLSDTQRDSASTSSGPSIPRGRDPRPISPMPAMPGADALNQALADLADITTSITPPETVRTHHIVSQASNSVPPETVRARSVVSQNSDMRSNIVSPASDLDVPIIKQPTPPIRSNLIESACNSDSDSYRSQRRNSNRSMKGRPTTKMQYYGMGMDKLEEDASEEAELFA